MNTTSTGEQFSTDLTPDEIALETFQNAPRKESERTYHFNAGGRNGTHSSNEAKKEQPKNRKEQVLEKLRSSTLSSDAFMNAPSGRWHIKDMFYVGQVGVMVGMWKAGKTFSAIHLAFRIAWGLPLMQPLTQENKPAKPLGEVRLKGNVLYIPSEGAGGLKDRIKAYRQFYGMEKPEDSAGDVLVYPHAFDVFSEPDLQALSEFCSERQVVFIIVDTLASNLAGLVRGGHSNPENDSGAMSLMFDNLTRVCGEQKHGCSGLFLHHPAKPSGGSSSTDARGSGGIEASARFKLTISAKDDGSRTLALGFNNDTDDSKAPTIPFRLENVSVGVTEDGDPKEVGVFKCGGVKNKVKTESREGQMLSAFAVAMDFNNIVDRKDWEACVKTNYPDLSEANFRYYLNELLKKKYFVEFPFKEFPKEEQARRNKKGKYYELTMLGMENLPTNGDPENTKRPWGWTEKHEAWHNERPDDHDSEEFKEWKKRKPADYV